MDLPLFGVVSDCDIIVYNGDAGGGRPRHCGWSAAADATSSAAAARIVKGSTDRSSRRNRKKAPVHRRKFCFQDQRAVLRCG